MNRSRLLSIMPYILGVLILILVGVIIFTGLGDDDASQGITPTPTQAASKEDPSKENPPVQKQEDLETPTTAPVDVPDEGSETADITDEPEPTATPVPTPTTAPTPTPITDLTMGYTFEKKADYVDTKDGVNLRKGASTDTDVVVMLENGQRLERTGYNDEWTRVIYDGQECYIATRLIIRAVESYDTVVEPEDTDDNTGDTASGSTSDSLTRASYYGAGAGKTVCIDPGHQSKGNSETEPAGPGSSETKVKTSSGTEGISTGVAEYVLNLEVSLKLKAELEARGYKVVMTRTTHDVNLSNKERAEIANDADADAFVRIHANASDNHSAHGMDTYCMTSDSPYNADLYDDSYRLSSDILKCACERTGANMRYINPTTEMSGINWSEVPVTILEMGFMTNEAEDKLLSNADYQAKIVVGIADGLDLFFSK